MPDALPIKPATGDDFQWELAAESITVRIRWFGLAVGYMLVNVVAVGGHQFALNAILTLGAVYAIIDTYFSLRGTVFLRQWPLFISAMEAVFIGLLCHFDQGLLSSFRFYYFLSLLVCAIRHPAWMTYFTFGLHSLSYATLAFTRDSYERDEFSALVFLLVLMGWMTWGTTALSELLKAAGLRLAGLNAQLKENQSLLELRIGERTRQLQESQAMLVQHEKQAAFGLLAAGIAHEVGNPLAAISSLVQLIQRKELDPQTRERLILVDDQLRRIQRTLRELIDFSRPASSELSFCDIHEVINEALSIAKYYKRKKGKHIHTAFAPGLPTVRIVRDQMVQVILNLVLNSLDATEEGGTIRIRTLLKNGFIGIDLRDDGHGITAAQRDKIFQPYFTTKSTGTGLGLFVCRNIMEQNGGQIELAETSEHGTTFTVRVTCEQVRIHPDVPPIEFANDHSLQEVSVF